MESIEDLKVSGQVPAGDSVGDLLSTPLSSRTSEMDASRHSHIKHGHEKGPGGDTLEAPTKHCPVHPHYLPTELEGLAWIAGKWSVHEPGKGRYPTIKDFTYAERIEFSYSGQKMLDYKAESWNPAVGPASHLHREVGFLRIKPAYNQVALVLAHNFGVSEILEGTNKENKLVLKTSAVNRISFAADPRVLETRRTFTYDPLTEELEHVMEMQTSRTPLTEHLRIKYKRDTHKVPDGH